MRRALRCAVMMSKQSADYCACLCTDNRTAVTPSVAVSQALVAMLGYSGVLLPLASHGRSLRPRGLHEVGWASWGLFVTNTE